MPVRRARDQWRQHRAQPGRGSTLSSNQNESLNNIDRVQAIHLEVDIQRQRLARDGVAVAVVFDWNEVRIVARHEGDGARGVGAEELREPPLKSGSETTHKAVDDV